MNSDEKQYKLFLLGGKEYPITYEECVKIAKIIMHFPSWKRVNLHGIVFCADDIDYERVKKSKRKQIDMFDKDTQQWCRLKIGYTNSDTNLKTNEISGF